jgi:hypothetical protein
MSDSEALILRLKTVVLNPSAPGPSIEVQLKFQVASGGSAYSIGK